jgi:hypothetical protein
MKVHLLSYAHAKARWALKPKGINLGRVVGASGVVAGLLLTGLAVPAEAATVYKTSLRTAARSLVVTPEVNTGYDRDRYFGVWIDTNRDCQNTRQEVLVQESRSAVTYTSRGCTASTGRWVTSWDNRVHTSASTVQIDHLVPVHEAWGSGARFWSQARRVAFYNDLGDTRTLSAQTSALNSSKQASGPEAWMPPANRCAYIGQWIAVKIRWGLRVDSAEKAALVRYADSCSNVTLTVTRV